MRTVVLQPMYIPWMGYFGMMDQADVFVHYDDVQFSKQSWQQRNRIKTTSGDELWLTIPVRKDHGQIISETMIDNSSLWRKKHWKSIESSYCKSPNFATYSSEIEKVYAKDWDSLADFNIEMIDTLSTLIGIRKPKTLRSSKISGIEGSKEERLLNLLNRVGASEYVSGPAAKDYINTMDFTERGIKLFWYEFSHPQYNQHIGEFIPYLSIIDLLFNEGDRSIDLIREGSSDALRAAL